MKKAIFLDRDGTINSDEGHYYIYKVEDFVFNPGVIDGIRRLNDALFSLTVFSIDSPFANKIFYRLVKLFPNFIS